MGSLISPHGRLRQYAVLLHHSLNIVEYKYESSLSVQSAVSSMAARCSHRTKHNTRSVVVAGRSNMRYYVNYVYMSHIQLRSFRFKYIFCTRKDVDQKSFLLGYKLKIHNLCFYIYMFVCCLC